MKYIVLTLVTLLSISTIASELTCSGKITRIETLRGSDSSVIRAELDGNKFYKVCIKSVSSNNPVECQGHLAMLLSAFHARNDVDLVFKSTSHAGLTNESSCEQINEWGPYLSDIALKL